MNLLLIKLTGFLQFIR